MFLLQFFRYLRGYVWFEARGGFVERFLNLVARDHIAVWSGRKREGVYSGCVCARDYRRLRSHAKKTGVRLRITQKQGAPFQRRRYRKRTGLLVGIVLFFAFLSGMSRFIWRIEIHGTIQLDEMTVLQALEALDIVPGTRRSAIDVRDCERKMLLLVPDLAFVALNIDGCALQVEISESVLPPEMVDPTKPCNIVAHSAGQITAMNVYSGQALVSVGDTVLPGDIIVSGITQDGRGQSLYRHARAEVFAETTQVLEVEVPYAQTRYTENGGIRKRRYLGLFGLDLPAFLPFGIPSPYRVVREEKTLRAFSTELPVYWLTETYLLMEETAVTLTETEAKQQAMRELGNLQKVRLEKAEILDRNIGGKAAESGYTLRAEYFCRMDIAVEREILLAPAPGE